MGYHTLLGPQVLPATEMISGYVWVPFDTTHLSSPFLNQLHFLGCDKIPVRRSAGRENHLSSSYVYSRVHQSWYWSGTGTCGGRLRRDCHRLNRPRCQRWSSMRKANVGGRWRQSTVPTFSQMVKVKSLHLSKISAGSDC